jgi:L-ascorbate metabolism protein UlaG (beta-lactamase superfamily)
MESVENGRANWAIPKELAGFSFHEHDGGRETVIVHRGDTKIFEATFRRGRIAFPVTTALMPVTLMQRMDASLYFTRFLGKGRARLARLESMSVNRGLFPDIAAIKPLLALRVDRFSLTFPVAKVEGESA